MYAVVRVRGDINVKPEIKRTLQLMNLTRINHCVVLEDSAIIKGMLQRAKDYITWGEIDKTMLTKLMKTRGRLEGNRELTADHVKNTTSFSSLEKLSDALLASKIKYKEIPEVKPIFRLHPPRKGYEGIKRSFVNRGALGYRGKEINALLDRMM
jgi:large subunit ribosomal protein L30